MRNPGFPDADAFLLYFGTEVAKQSGVASRTGQHLIPEDVGMADTVTKTCEGCGGSISTEQIVARQAGLVHGVLLCPVCVDKKRQEAIAAQKAAEADIALVEGDDAPATQSSSKIRSFATGSTLAGAHHDAKLKRPLAGPNEPATRVRTFHSKLTPAALAHMDDLINEWLDAHPDIYIKQTCTTVGNFEAKHVEPHLVVSIFY